MSLRAPPPPALELDAATERAAVNLLRNLEWQADDFALIFVFADVGPGLQLARWLDERLVLQGRKLQQREFDKEFVADADGVLERLMANLGEVNTQPGALWLSLNRHPSDSQWNQARERFVARLNERRFLLERDLLRPFVLVLPVAYRSVLQSMAPDIWHVRATSEELRAKAGSVEPESTRAGNGPERLLAVEPARSLRAFEDWTRLQAGAAPLQSLLPLARFAVGELLDAGRPADAVRVARETLAATRRAESESGSDADATPSLRRLSLALDLLGDAQRASGDWAAAGEASRESLALSRQLVERLGGTPQALRDLSVSLDNVGQVAQAGGDWAAAGEAYRESLALRRQLVGRLGGTPEALDDLALSLMQVARLPDGDPAARDEAVSIMSRLVKRFPEVTRYQDLVEGWQRDNSSSDIAPASPGENP